MDSAWLCLCGALGDDGRGALGSEVQFGMWGFGLRLCFGVCSTVQARGFVVAASKLVR